MKVKYLAVIGVAVAMLSACTNTAPATADANPEAASAEQGGMAPARGTDNTSAAAEATGYKPGDMASDFTLKNVDGSMVSLAGNAGEKGAIVVFTCNHCPYAQKYESRIMELDKKYRAMGYPVIAVNPNDPSIEPEDSYEEMQKRSTERGYTFPYLIDEGQQVYPMYGATKTPHVYLLKKEATGMKVAYIGAIDDNYEDASAVKARYVEDAINDLEAGREVKNTMVKAIGCSIKDKRKG